ncbi:preprotein translocase subunit SecE [Candidatus Absconditicoccus praedator]|uniref:preprotein translocase subunit SecE n=1 Tax=Candidatus Absconditicoccus praedator TaxID=2735562 RepID=UPI001E45F484|nr:preprotein translocase subunit SecE [Candidatus Absconditicoccus praedator]UFX83241.1 preprotein translocase subunit SecE [Candidatus Absconditicoccus praedator]
MLKFFYDSLETLKQVKKPTKNEVINLAIAVFIIVIIAAGYFAAVDGVFINLYQTFYQIMS